MSREYVATPFSYSSAVAVGDLVFLGLHRGYGDTFLSQLDDTLAALGATLGRFDLPLENLVKVGVWLSEIHDLPTMEARFAELFPAGCFPARMTATTQFIDADCLVMLDGIAHRAEGRA